MPFPSTTLAAASDLLAELVPCLHILKNTLYALNFPIYRLYPSPTDFHYGQ